jgi:hypothetical protein
MTVYASAVALVLGAAVAEAQGGILDHLLCYKVKDRLKNATKVDMLADLQPEFTQKGCTLLKPLEFCVPATKANIDPAQDNDIGGQALQNDFICYQAKCPNDIKPPAKRVTDQFGRHVLERYKPVTVCVPAKKDAFDCGPLPNGVCGGVCVDPTQECTTDTAGNCTCVPKATCEGKPDKAGACGGTCTDPLQRCLPDLASPTSAAVVCACRNPDPPVCGLNSLTGTCGGTCPNMADKCVMVDAATGHCTCQPSEVPCSTTDSGACGGTCPLAGQTCTTIAGTNICTCDPPALCGQNAQTGACGGYCQSPLVCTSQPGTPSCECLPPPCGSDASGGCAGRCTSGTSCKPDATGACNCQ